MFVVFLVQILSFRKGKETVRYVTIAFVPARLRNDKLCWTWPLSFVSVVLFYGVIAKNMNISFFIQKHFKVSLEEKFAFQCLSLKHFSPPSWNQRLNNEWESRNYAKDKNVKTKLSGTKLFIIVCGNLDSESDEKIFFRKTFLFRWNFLWNETLEYLKV